MLDTAMARARLLEALRSLREILARGPDERFPFGIIYMTHGNRYPRAAEAWCAADAVLGQLNEDIAPRVDLSEIQGFILNNVGQLDRLPAPPSMRQKLDEWTRDLGSKAPNDNDGPWSTPDTPARWAKRFKVSPRTFKRHVAGGKIRAKPLSDRSYQIHLDDLPKDPPAPVAGQVATSGQVTRFRLSPARTAGSMTAWEHCSPIPKRPTFCG